MIMFKKKQHAPAAAAFAAACAALACGAAAAVDGETFNKYFDSAENPVLTKSEAAGLAIARAYNKGALSPVAGPNGAILFAYGSGTPSIVCAPLQVCDVMLQAGETVNSINAGDSARWLIEPAVTGTGAEQRQHLIIKPLDVGLNTTMVVATDRRAYHIRLKSHKTAFMPLVAFTYPEELMARWEQAHAVKAAEREEKTIPETGESLDRLDFNYRVEGSASWKPVRVYSTGRQTIIQLPKAVAANEVPTLLVLRKEGGLFSDEDLEIVNYRVQGDRYVVDQLLEKAVLIAGVGSDQNRVTITHVKAEGTK